MCERFHPFSYPPQTVRDAFLVYYSSLCTNIYGTFIPYKQITIVTFGWIGFLKKFFTKEPLRTVPVGDDESHRVDPRFKGKLVETPREGVTTLYDLAADAFLRYGGRNCMGSRKFLGWKVPGKVKHFGDDIIWRSYAEMGTEAHNFGAALRAVGVVPAPDHTNLDPVTNASRIAIFENTCAEWMIAAMGAFTQVSGRYLTHRALRLGDVVLDQ
jgi:long-chain acyl-CoA synthetase